MENRPTVARLSFPTEKGLQSPVLIDLDQLEALDEIIDKYAGKLRKDRDEQIDKATDAEIYERVVAGRLKQEEVETRRAHVREFVTDLRSWKKEVRSVTIYLSRGRQIDAHNFAEAIGQPLVQEEIPTGFLLSLRIGAIQARVRAGRPWGDVQLAIEVEPNELEISQGLFGALENWASDVEAPKWQQKWAKYQIILSAV